MVLCRWQPLSVSSKTSWHQRVRIQWSLRKCHQLETKGTKSPRLQLTGTLGAFLDQPQSQGLPLGGVAICLVWEAHQKPCSCCYSLINSVDAEQKRGAHYQNMCLSVCEGHAHHLHKLTSKTLGQAAFKKKKLQDGHYHH